MRFSGTLDNGQTVSVDRLDHHRGRSAARSAPSSPATSSSARSRPPARRSSRPAAPPPRSSSTPTSSTPASTATHRGCGGHHRRPGRDGRARRRRSTARSTSATSRSTGRTSTSRAPTAARSSSRSRRPHRRRPGANLNGVGRTPAFGPNGTLLSLDGQTDRFAPPRLVGAPQLHRQRSSPAPSRSP